MKKRLTSVAPLRAGIVLAILYGFLALIIAPFLLIAGLVGARAGGAGAGIGMAVFAVAMPFLYAAIGFVFGVIGAALYNLIARWTGGLELEFTDVPSPGQAT
jgi:hypothetical protein